MPRSSGAKETQIRLWIQLPALVVAAAAVLAGCPRGFEPAAAPSVSSPDPEKQRRFSRAQARFDGGGLEQADAQFKAFITAASADPLAPLAAVYRGRIALRRGTLEQARTQLTVPAQRPKEDAVGLQARYYLGLTLVRLGDAAGGRRLLRPYLKLVKDDARPALLAALARAARKLGQRTEAIGHLSTLHMTTTRPTERSFARQGLEALISLAPAAELKLLLDGAEPKSLVAALAGARLAALAVAARRWEEAQALLTRTAEARAAHSVEAVGASKSRRLIGLLVPFSGRYRVVGERLLTGAIEASGALTRRGQGGRSGKSGKGATQAVGLVVRDSSADPAAAARELIDKAQVSALAGALSPSAARAAAEVASRRAVPFVTLARLGASKAGAPLSLLPDNTARAAALARHAARLKLGRIVVLRPESSYGRSMAKAFTLALKRGPVRGATVVQELKYPAKTASFTALAEKLRKAGFDGIFIPDAARTVGLLAPALARVGLWSSTIAATRAARNERHDRKKKHRSFTLLATADGLSPRQLGAASRYLQGAVLAPGYYADRDAPRAGPLVRGFEASQGHPPGLIEALGFDCVQLFAAHMKGGNPGRAGLLAALRGGKRVNGLTGAIRFTAEGRRADPPLLYRIEGQRARQLPQDPSAATAAPRL